MTMNTEKCDFSSKQIKFPGHQIDERGISPNLNKIHSIVKKARPQDVGELRRFLRMVNQMTKFSPHLAKVTRLLREQQQEEAFNKIKVMLTSTPILALYHPKKKPILLADASSHRIGEVVVKVQGNAEWKLIVYKL